MSFHEKVRVGDVLFVVGESVNFANGGTDIVSAICHAAGVLYITFRSGAVTRTPIRGGRTGKSRESRIDRRRVDNGRRP